MSSVSFDTRDLKRFEQTCKRLGGIPPKIATKAASKSFTVVRRSVRPKIPVGETGQLKRGVIRKGERSRVKGKKVYDLMFDPGMNDVFQKPVKNPGAAGSTSTKSGHAYYPASQEYGFLTRSKGGGYSYVPGYHFMQKGTVEAAPAATAAGIDAAMKEIEKEWMKR